MENKLENIDLEKIFWELPNAAAISDFLSPQEKSMVIDAVYNGLKKSLARIQESRQPGNEEKVQILKEEVAARLEDLDPFLGVKELAKKIDLTPLANNFV